MAVYALGDLHLSHAVNKPMAVFGEQWTDHCAKIATQWRQIIRETDVVLLPGDISWAMTLDEAEPDLTWIGELPGQKIMIRGNHDYWWSGITKVRKRLSAAHVALQNDAIASAGYAISGTRGWLLPTHPKFTQADLVVYHREGERLRMSLERAQSLGLPIITMLHYPPMGAHAEPTIFTQLLEEFKVKICVYGHLHGLAHRFAVEGLIRGTDYHLVSADYVHFTPVCLAP